MKNLKFLVLIVLLAQFSLTLTAQHDFTKAAEQTKTSNISTNGSYQEAIDKYKNRKGIDQIRKANAELAEMTKDCTPHANFREIVNYLNNEDIAGGAQYFLEVTIVNHGTTRGTHRFTAFGRSYGGGEIKKCGQTIPFVDAKLAFSDRKDFKGNKDIIGIEFNPWDNSVEITLKSWGGTKLRISNLKKSGNLLYGFERTGIMYIFNLRKGSGLIYIQSGFNNSSKRNIILKNYAIPRRISLPRYFLICLPVHTPLSLLP